MSLSYSDLTASQREFADRVCADLHANRDVAVLAVYGDGSNGLPKFAAARQGAQWNVCFDFSTGRCFNTAVQLPSDWAHEARRAA